MCNKTCQRAEVPGTDVLLEAALGMFSRAQLATPNRTRWVSIAPGKREERQHRSRRAVEAAGASPRAASYRNDASPTLYLLSTGPGCSGTFSQAGIRLLHLPCWLVILDTYCLFEGSQHSFVDSWVVGIVSFFKILGVHSLLIF